MTPTSYDMWIIGQNCISRWHFYNDPTQKYNISTTNIGICQDFANVLAIMCRSVGIPADVVISNTHAWTIVYIYDYNRWVNIDVTADIKYYVYSEDMSRRTLSNSNGIYKNIDNSTKIPINISIGNPEDMFDKGLTYTEWPDVPDEWKDKWEARGTSSTAH